MMGAKGVDRRTLLARALLLVGASVVSLPFEALAAVEADLLSDTQRATLVAAADTLVPQTDTPGAVDVGVPALFEGLLANWAAPATATALADVLDRLAALGGGFAALSAAERKATLQAFDAAALAPSDAPRANPFGPPPAADPAYQQFKELVLTLYYLSQPALTQELAYTHVPGRWESSVIVTSATRPQGGPGMF
ncbi:gluconate 2-dehydrogenase subunit 3 family protein [Alteraurantiacibacter buctensis]|uniref:Gluconate 2-dehydrogenase subunit 3 family protein n=1 Tax=Alteraurantiacibacter buctensis TaxID=1503981 RepID=A0A844YY07_9SPHN|nr:gluconate 2-dehydrogenase subunit 3 family protein [Alteraurantiacibacter buctensis]MXO71906.1 hypothetical protein [Alteraurantiacibacter buctensis]